MDWCAKTATTATFDFVIFLGPLQVSLVPKHNSRELLNGNFLQVAHHSPVTLTTRQSIEGMQIYVQMVKISLIHVYLQALHKTDKKRDDKKAMHWPQHWTVSGEWWLIGVFSIVGAFSAVDIVRPAEVSEDLVNDSEVWWEKLHKLVHVFNNLSAVTTHIVLHHVLTADQNRPLQYSSTHIDYTENHNDRPAVAREGWQSYSDWPSHTKSYSLLQWTCSLCRYVNFRDVNETRLARDSKKFSISRITFLAHREFQESE